MPIPMAPRFLLLALGVLTSLGVSAQTPAPPAPPPTVTVRGTVSHLDPKTGKSDVMSFPSVSVISGSEARVSVAGRPDPKDPKGKPESSMDLVISPTVQPDGMLSISVRVSISHKAEVIDPKDAKRERKRESKAHDGTLVFYSVSQGPTHQELHLYKSSVEASASELSTVVTIRPGEIAKVPGVGGLELSVSGIVSATPVAR